jgi:O-acetyl-ADP-ribose deacetylase (regulator of RNase III)
MIEFRKGDWIGPVAEALVNAVNTAGMMGRGIALRFK